MDRFSENGGDKERIKPPTIVAVEEFQVSVEQFTDRETGEEALIYKIAAQDREDRAMLAFDSQAAAALVGAVLHGAAHACDELFLAQLMVSLTERPEESLDILFGSGHAKDNLPDF